MAGSDHILRASDRSSSGDALRDWLAATARDEGFTSIAIGPASLPDYAASGLDDFLSDGFQGDMDWLDETAPRRRAPTNMWSGAKTAIICTMNYGPDHDPMDNLAHKSAGNISVYARGKDYHEVIKGRLKQLASRLVAKTGAEVKVFVDTAPLMEKPLAAMAGVGWQGKHTNLVSREAGSWLFLGTILTTAELPHDSQGDDHCGSCRACLDVCPTNAFPAPYRLDASKCISYLTIEHKGHIPADFRQAIGNRIFGCDDCLAVCPWNKYAAKASEAKLAARAETSLPPLADLLILDDAEFRTRFAGTPVRRAGYDRFMRNVLIAAGNSNDDALIPLIEAHLTAASPLMRAMAVWALGQFQGTAQSFAALRAQHQPTEQDPAVGGEWDRAKK
ncbi:tRNA epoxyqueuosine(34) reductase QueG [Alphaproteobacteria bacterium]|nr:tRNA epoxyqueuosine(34) reductase QueG [Alphaproteobacteria bacterium]